MEMYVLDVSTLPSREEAARALLSPARREKALRLRSGEVRGRSIGAGLLLRRFLGDADVRLAPGGKPFVPGGREFSLSHSGVLAVIALGDEAVGADVEKIFSPSETLSRRVFSERERRWAEAAGEEGFAFLWTRKEALLKCPGRGIDRALAEVCVLPGEAPVLDGVTYALHTVRFRDSMLSGAARHDAVFRPQEITLEELLN